MGNSYLDICRDRYFVLFILICIHGSILVCKAEIDRLIISKGVPVPHKLWVCLLAPITIYSWHQFNHGLFLPMVLIHGSLYWILFDIYLNLRRGLDWDYIGEDPTENGSTMDKFLSWFKSRGINVLVPKVVVLAVTVGFYWLMKNN